MSLFYCIFNLGAQELILIAVIILIFFGGRKIPELMKGLGKGIREFNNAKANIETEIKENIKEIEAPAKQEVKEKVERS